jgi:xylan 1,4-beta-xylosidase
MGDVCASYSYWTFGDVFEEAGVAFTPFSGCFGLLANGSIPKPTYWAFSFFKDLGTKAVARDENFVITKDDQDNIHGVAWNPAEEQEGKELTLDFTIEVDNGEYVMISKLVDETVCNPLKTWIDLGEPESPTSEQLALLRAAACPQIRTRRFEVTDGKASLQIPLTENALCYFELRRLLPERDRGFLPERIRGAR